MVKKIISSVTVFSMVIALLVIAPIVSASAKTYGTWDDLKSGYRYTYLDEDYKTFRVDGFIDINKLPNKQHPAIMEIPKEIDGAVPVAIKALAFVNVTSREVIFPKTITTIGQNAFTGSGLASVEIPATVKTVENYAFSKCQNLISATISSKVENVGNNLFENCQFLRTLTFEEGTTAISPSIAKDCNRLETVNFPETVKTIGFNAFMNCQKIKEIYIPKTVETIGIQAFGYISAGNKMSDFTIKAEKNTTAQEYAVANDITFKELKRYLYGDVLNDGKINIIDILMLSQYKAYQIDFNEIQKKCADVSADGKVSLVDISTLQKFTSTQLAEFPSGKSFLQ